MDEENRPEDAAQASASEAEDTNTVEIDDSADVQAEIEKLKKDYLYLAAEFDNYRKHAVKERSDLLKFGSERIVRELLDVMDNFERALSVSIDAQNVESFKDGVKMIHSELQALLLRFGVTESNPAGEMFDPNQHEALTSEPTLEHRPGIITKVFRKAYKLHDRLIRPAQVVVAKEPSEQKD